MELFLQQLVSGISIGAVYSLLAVGYALVYSVYNFTNWAFDAFHGIRRIYRFLCHFDILSAVLGCRGGFDPASPSAWP